MVHRRDPWSSMEPPPFGDGNTTDLGSVQSAMDPSMEPPPFGDGNYADRHADWWKVVLQWSHRPSAMETSGKPVPWGGKREPSMEPPPFGDGNRAAPARLTTPRDTFNGATALRRWKPPRLELLVNVI